jgi:fibrillarin-like rRNA methylase
MSRRSGNKSTEIGWGVQRIGRSLWSRNAVKGIRHRAERLKKIDGKEWRQWPIQSSKLGAALMRTENDPSLLLPESGEHVLYLGSGHGTTIAHLHDHLCGANNHHGGRIVALDHSTRCIRDLISLAKIRPGIVPVCADVRSVESIAPFVPKRVSWLFQDISQAGQAEIFITASKRFLTANGVALLSMKAASDQRIEGGISMRYKATEETLEAAGFILQERIDLTGLEEKHALFFLHTPESWP